MVPAKQTLIWTLQVCEEPDWQLKTILPPNRVCSNVCLRNRAGPIAQTESPSHIPTCFIYIISYRYSPLQSLSQLRAGEDIKKSRNRHLIAIISVALTGAPCCVNRRMWNQLCCESADKKRKREARIKVWKDSLNQSPGGSSHQSKHHESDWVQPGPLVRTSSGGGLR